MNPQSSRPDQMYAQMLAATRQALLSRPPEAIARDAAVGYDPHARAFSVPTLGETVRIAYPDCAFSPPLTDWHRLVTLHYLNNARGALPDGEWIAMGSLRDGLVRGAKFDREAGARIGALLGRRTPAEAMAALRALGGTPAAGAADLSAALPFLPRYPLMLNLWFADDEFDGSARLLVNRGAAPCLSVEDAVTVGEIFIARLTEAVSRL